MRTTKQIIQCKKYPICYTLLIKKVKNINMHIERNGEIVVSANAFVPLERIDDFVSDKIAWIQKHREAMYQRNQQVIRSDKEIMLFGKTYQIKYTQGRFNHVSYAEDKVHVVLKEGADQEKVIQQFLDKLCRDVFSDIAKITYRMLEDYRLEYPTIKIRMMKSRWGSCMPAKHQITLNKQLIHYPIAFIEYVILHEFVHFIQPNHSKAFYHVIENYMPDYRERMALAR